MEDVIQLNATFLNVVLFVGMLSLLVGVALAFFTERWKHFGQYTAFYGIVTIGTWLALDIRLDDPFELTRLIELREVLHFSLGLDTGLYPLVGATMFLWAHQSDNRARWRGYSYAMWVQGPPHFLTGFLWLQSLPDPAVIPLA